MTSIISNRYKSSLTGFTIVELMAVIIIIGILSTLVIVAYPKIAGKAKLSQVEADLRNAIGQIDIHQSLTSKYPSTLTEINNNQGYSPSEGISVAYRGNTYRYCVEAWATSNESLKLFYSSQTEKISAGECGYGPDTIELGDGISCAIADGSLYCWGDNEVGQLGVGDRIDRYTPTQARGIFDGKTVTSVSARGYHTCAIMEDNLYCWGDNYMGQLGLGDTTDRYNPVLVEGNLVGKTVTAVNVGDESTCSVANGDLYCWGKGNNGQLGLGDTSNRNLPTLVTGALTGKTVTDVAIHYYHACAIAEGNLYCWGWNGNGELGLNDTVDRTSPALVTGVLTGKTVSSVSVGQGHTCAIADNQAYCWGHNTNGKLGLGDTTTRLTPTLVSGALSGKTISRLSSGYDFNCALAEGDAYCWGFNGADGQLGLGDTTHRYSPTLVTGALSGKTVSDLSLGTGHACVIADDDVYCWSGTNASGKLGTGEGDTTVHTSPVRITSVPWL